MVKSRFHGVTTVAELKPLDRRRSPVRPPGFHGVTTVAELKPFETFRIEARVAVSTASQPWPN